MSDPRSALLRSLVLEIEREMRRLGIWTEGAGPAPVAGVPYLAMGFHRWLQLHFLPGVLAHLETGIEGGIPSVDVGAIAVRELDHGPGYDALVSLCCKVGQLVRSLPRSAFTTTWQPWPPPQTLAPSMAVVHLEVGDGEPVAAWAGFERAPALRVDLRAHPDARFRAERVLELTVDARGGQGRVALRPGLLGPLRGGELPLVPRATLDWPAPRLLRRLAHEPVRHALQLNDVSDDLRNALRSYERTWWVTHPYEASHPCVAQLSGFPLSWSDDGEEKLRCPVVLRTYRDAAPWVEVLSEDGLDRLSVHVRKT